MTQTTVKPTPDPSDPAKRVRLVLWILMGVIIAAGLVWYAVFSTNKPAPAAPQPAASAQLVREDSHRLTSPAVEKAQLVDVPEPRLVLDQAGQLRRELGDRERLVRTEARDRPFGPRP